MGSKNSKHSKLNRKRTEHISEHYIKSTIKSGEVDRNEWKNRLGRLVVYGKLQISYYKHFMSILDYRLDDCVPYLNDRDIRIELLARKSWTGSDLLNLIGKSPSVLIIGTLQELNLYVDYNAQVELDNILHPPEQFNTEEENIFFDASGEESPSLSNIENSVSTRSYARLSTGI